MALYTITGQLPSHPLELRIKPAIELMKAEALTLIAKSLEEIAENYGDKE